MRCSRYCPIVAVTLRCCNTIMWPAGFAAMIFVSIYICLGCIVMTSSIEAEESKPRARDLGIPFDGTPGPLNAITERPNLRSYGTQLTYTGSVLRLRSLCLDQLFKLKLPPLAGAARVSLRIS